MDRKKRGLITVVAVAAAVVLAGIGAVVLAAVGALVWWNHDELCKSLKHAVVEDCCEEIEQYGAFYDDSNGRCDIHNVSSGSPWEPDNETTAVESFRSCMRDRVELFGCEGP